MTSEEYEKFNQQIAQATEAFIAAKAAAETAKRHQKECQLALDRAYADRQAALFPIQVPALR